MLKTHYWLNNCQEQYLKASSFSFEVNIMNSNLEKAKATNFKADGRKKNMALKGRKPSTINTNISVDDKPN